MEEIVQGKLTEGELSKFQALKARCLQSVENDLQITKNSDSLCISNDCDCPAGEDLESSINVEDDSGKILTVPEAPVMKVRTDSVSEAGYVIPKFEEVPSEFLV